MLDSELLTEVETYLRQEIGPQAERLDRDPQALLRAVQEMGDRRWLALRVPPPWNDCSINESSFRQFQELVARHSGALAFLQTQHQSAGAILAQSQNFALQQAYLPQMATGQVLIGVGFSQLRRQGDPAVKATPIADGYQIYGEVPWVTGFGSFHHFILGATLPDGRALFGLVPFQQQQQTGGGAIDFSPPLQLAAMASTNTVKAMLTRWFLPESSCLFIQPTGWIQTRDRQNVLQHAFFALGCARAGLDILASAQPQLPEFAAATWRSLDHELQTCRHRIYRADANPDYPDDRLHLRAWAIDLAARCTHAAVIVSRGAANYSHHPAQRVYREALAFTVFGQTTAVMEATLKRLIRE
jgi:alkylation response protein AidB-like acyl-CoA dehydrogenase